MIKRGKKRGSNEEMGGQDSFLDIISNIVGILIILVMIAGVRAQSSPTNLDEENYDTLKPQYIDDVQYKEVSEKYKKSTEKAAEAIQVRDSIDMTLEQLENITFQLELQSAEQAQLFEMLVSKRTEIEAKAESRDLETRERVELQRQIQEIDAKIGQMDKTRNWIQSNRPKATVLENIPTPISKTVEDKEAQFRLLGGRLAYVPISELMEKLEFHISSNKNKYFKQNRSSGTLGPLDGFQLEYTIISYDTVMRDAYGMGVGRKLELEYAEFVPTHDQLGQSIQEAVQSPNSDLQNRLRGYRQDIYTITVWVYPDSFEEFRQLKQFLYSKGYRVAARPMEAGSPISGSPSGTKSSSQ